MRMAGVRAKWLHEVREVLSQEDFREWFERLEGLRKALEQAQSHYEELLTEENLAEFRSELAQKNAIDTLYQASEAEDEAARMEAEATDLENNAMENLGGFESQRLKTSELWFKLEACDHDLDKAQKNKDQAKIAEISLGIRRTREEYEREAARKQRMWEEVEAMWANALEKSLLLREKRMKGRAVRKVAERLFAEAEEQKEHAQKQKSAAEVAAVDNDRVRQELEVHVARARDLFAAVVLEDFMYWQQREDDKAVWLVPLISDSGNYNIDFHACSVFRCDWSKGVEFIEPLIDAEQNGLPNDARLDAFFGLGQKERDDESGEG